ncbi:phosphohydrolase [Palaeococcus pacificus DY20341]|uniref:Phosphohydrolase n=1 Tax=Palaeococcus pacificus DY20341 TaxID=1343739 RepID=A0A075LU19_9EURY|nr:HD domain-containing protein [Palaeococcus pacificus]AIF69601.1 phosphohydrolase [Palaeococcus pacificus DY20341]
MKVIRDAIHGDIILDDFAVRLVDTPEFQRLRRITQLSFSYLAYPSARHTRFEHSIGTYSIAQKIYENNRDTVEGIVVYAALLHDLGHYPFSHVLEIIYGNHEENTRQIIKKGEIGDVIGENYSLNEFLRLLKHPVVSGDIDADRMDYLMRDAYYTGVAHGLIDLDRLIRNLHYDGEKLIVKQKGIIAAESLLVARSTMYPIVYQHHVSRIAASMLVKAVEIEGIPKGEIARMDEIDLVARLRGSEHSEVRELMKAIDDRKLYKRVLYTNTPLENPSELKKALEEEFGHLTLFDYPRYPKFEESQTYVEFSGEIKRLNEVSPLVRSLVELKDKYWKWGVYARRDKVEEVGAFLERLIF